MKLFFLTEGVFEEVGTAMLFFQSVIFFYIFGMRWIELCIWLLINRSWRYLQMWCFRRGSHCEIFQSVCNARKKRCVLGQNLTEYSLKCTLYPNICNKTHENYTQIYAVRKLVPKCAHSQKWWVLCSFAYLRWRRRAFLAMCTFRY
jgi:hypothetical protein